MRPSGRASEASGLPYAAVAVNIRAQENRQPAYLRINPSGAVPALGVGDQVLTESQAILTWVAGCEGEVWCYEPIPPYACGCTVGAMRLS